MPELLARSQNDFVVTAPRKRPPRGRAKRAEWRKYVPGFVLARPGRTLAGTAFAAVLAGIVLNATLFQTARHPAPLFSSGQTVQPIEVVVPFPAPRPDDLAQPVAPGVLMPPAPVPGSAPPAVPASPVQPHAAAPPVQPHAAAPRPAPEPARRDPIGLLIKGDLGKAEPPPPADPSPRVEAAQRALVHAGYVLRSDGVMGATTRNAIEKFEKDHGLPVTGDLTPRTLRELTAQSGVPIP